MKLLNRSAITLRAKQPFYQWINGLALEEPGPASLAELRREGNVYLLDEVDHPDDFQAQLQAHWVAIFENELSAWNEDGRHWPAARSLTLLTYWFDIDHQLMIFDVSPQPLLLAPLDEAALL